MQTILTWMNMFLAACNICIMGYMFIKFMKKPHDTLEARIEKVETDLDDVKKMINEHQIKLTFQDKTNAVFKSVMLSFVNFEIAYCRNSGYKDNQDLLDAKRELESYLTGNDHER